MFRELQKRVIFILFFSLFVLPNTKVLGANNESNNHSELKKKKKRKTFKMMAPPTNKGKQQFQKEIRQIIERQEKGQDIKAIVTDTNTRQRRSSQQLDAINLNINEHQEIAIQLLREFKDNTSENFKKTNSNIAKFYKKTTKKTGGLLVLIIALACYTLYHNLYLSNKKKVLVSPKYPNKSVGKYRETFAKPYKEKKESWRKLFIFFLFLMLLIIYFKIKNIKINN